MGIELIIHAFVLLRKIGVWLGLIEKPAEPTPSDPIAGYRLDERAVPTLVVDDQPPALPPRARFSAWD